MLTRVGLAFVNVQFAPFATVALGAVANELADTIFTASAIHTRIRLAFVDVTQTAGVEIATRTIAFKTVDQIRTFT